MPVRPPNRLWRGCRMQCRLRGSRRLRRAPHVMVGASSVSCVVLAVVLAVAAAPLAAQPPGAEEEIGSVHWGRTVVWLRATDAGDVKVFASAGYRNAFVQPVVASADDVDRWAAVLEQLGDTRSATTPQSVDDHSPEVSDTVSQRTTLAAGDLVLEARLMGAKQPKVIAWIGATRPDVVVALQFPDAAKQGAALLRAAAQTARHLHSAAVAAAAPPPTPVEASTVASNTVPTAVPT